MAGSTRFHLHLDSGFHLGVDFFLSELTDPMVLKDPVEESTRAKFAEAWFTRVNTQNRKEL